MKKIKMKNCRVSVNRITRFGLKIVLVMGLILILPAISTARYSATRFICACCAEPGTWSLETRKIEGQEIQELNRLKLNDQADFYTTAAWPDDISGVLVPTTYEPRYFVVSLVREKGEWKFFFKTSKGEKGALILMLPGTATFFNADIEKKLSSIDNTATTLYKEIRFEGSLRGTGIFAKGIEARTKYRLILQGRGTGCTVAEDFYRWNLRVAGARAKYTLYGFLDKSAT